MSNLSKKANEWLPVMSAGGDMSMALGHSAPGSLRAHGFPTRRLDEMPEEAPDGAVAVAMLTVWAKEQKLCFERLRESLDVLASLKDWSESFLVASTAIQGFDWKRVPFKKYESFYDFYGRELIEVWTEWDELQRKYTEIAEKAWSQERCRVCGELGTADNPLHAADVVQRHRQGECDDRCETNDDDDCLVLLPMHSRCWQVTRGESR